MPIVAGDLDRWELKAAVAGDGDLRWAGVGDRLDEAVEWRKEEALLEDEDDPERRDSLYMT